MDGAALHVHPGDQLRLDRLDLAVRGRVLNPKIKGVLVADDVFHDREARRVALGLDHLLVFPLAGTVRRKEAGRLCAGAVHNVLDVAGDGLDGGVAFPFPFLGDLLELLKEHLDRAQVGGEPLVKPNVFNDGPLLVGEAWEGGFLPGPSA
ncbi:hypothetical protein SDC9_122236 [bioreactor metagenome]|uniref:Uncharacterized protein n=1 Tax=bioreactor metagenome TaxID=1076179 RepID=A0A645CE97_9ZZZZ